MNVAKSRRVTRLSTLTFVVVLREMLRGPRTANQIIEASGLHRDTVYRLLRAMTREADGLRAAHVSAWQDDALGRPTIAVYSIGHGKDASKARKPLPLSAVGN